MTDRIGVRLVLQMLERFQRNKPPTRAEREAAQDAELRVRSAELGVREANLELQLALRERRRALNG